MFEAFDQLLFGLSLALTWQNLLYALVGSLIGMSLGVLPGVGQSMGIAILIPVTYFLDPLGAIIMLAAIFYGAMYGGTISAVLLNVPGESEAVATTFDGHPLARKGRAGVALSVAAVGSFIGGICATLALVALALPLSRLALLIGPPEYLVLMLIGLSLIVALVGRSKTKGLMMAALGLALSVVGLDPIQGTPRFTFGNPVLFDGIPLLAIILGFFGLSDVLLRIARTNRDEPPARMSAINSLYPSRAEIKASVWPVARGTVIGTGLGLIPGMIASMSSFTSYVAERSLARDRSRFGKGAIEGVAGPETANNAFGNASFIPLLTLGIPGSAAIAILLAAFKIHGLTPGPLMFSDHPDIAWGFIASMLVGNTILLVLALPLVRLWVALLKMPPYLLMAIVLSLSMIGVYSVSRNIAHVLFLVGFAIAGTILKSYEYPLAPAILAFVLGDKIESSLRQSLSITHGNVAELAMRPGVLSLLGAAILGLISLAAWRRRPAQSRRTEDAAVKSENSRGKAPTPDE